MVSTYKILMPTVIFLLTFLTRAEWYAGSCVKVDVLQSRAMDSRDGRTEAHFGRLVLSGGQG